ncbi:hypothetical protein ACU6TU_00550 [Halomonas sp. LS-001]
MKNINLLHTSFSSGSIIMGINTDNRSQNNTQLTSAELNSSNSIVFEEITAGTETSITEEASEQTLQESADFNNDGVIDVDDLLAFREIFGANDISEGSTEDDADFDGNGTVDVDDLLMFRDLFGQTVDTPETEPETPELLDDHGDTIGSATAIELGTSMEGTIEIVSDRDFFAVDLEEGQRYLFQMTPEDVETASLDLYSPSGSFLEYDSDRDLAQFSYIAESSGTYYLEAADLGDDGTGSYSIMVDTVTLDDDHGDTIANATAIEVGTSLEGTIEIVSDRDFFAVDLEEGQRYLFQMTPEDVETASLDLYSPSGSFLEYDSDRDLAQFSYIAESSGTYYLEAADLGDDGTGSYSIMVDTVTLDDDHGDTIASATAIEVGTSLEGTIEIVSDRDFFAVDLEEGQRYLFQMTPEDVETASLDLYSPSGSFLEYDSDRDLAQFSYIAESSGTYYLEAADLGDDGTGSYSIMVDTVTLDDDHGDTIASATAIEVGTSLEGTIEIVSDRDFFAVDLEEGQRYLFQMTPEDVETASLDLYSPSGSFLEYDSDRDLAQFSYIAESSGTYYLEAADLGDDGTGSYSIMVDTVTLDDDHGDTIASATAIEVGTSLEGTIEIVSDRDFFAVDLEEGQRYLFQMTPEDVETASLDLYSPSGSFLEYDSDRDLAQFSYIAESSGTYYLEAADLGDDGTGSYSIMVDTVTLDDDHGDTIASATAIEVGTSLEGTIEIVSDRDFFAVDLEEGQRYLFQMTPEDVETASLDLYSPSGSFLEYDSDRDLAQFSYIAESSGTYYLEAADLGDDGTGSYTVSVSGVTAGDDGLIA